MSGRASQAGPAAPFDQVRTGAAADGRRDFAAVVLLTVALLGAFYATSVGYDLGFSLVWGDDLVHGRPVRFDTTFAPTPHPLTFAAGAVAALFGTGAYAALLAMCALAFAAAVVGVYRLTVCGTGLWWAGVVAALILLTRPPVLQYGLQGAADSPALALIVWALVVAIRSPAKPWQVLALLTLAGLLRPEAWLLTGLYSLYAASRVPLAHALPIMGATLVAPVLWCLVDLAVTGDPLWSLHGTSDLAEALDRPTGLTAVPGALADGWRFLAGGPVVVAGVLGLLVGAFAIRTPAVVAALALTAVSISTYCLLGVAGLPLIDRYLIPSTAMLAVGCGLAASQLPGLAVAVRPPRWTTAAAAVAALATLVALAQAPSRMNGLRTKLARLDASTDALRAITADATVRKAIGRCRSLYVPTTRYLPAARFASRSSVNQVRLAQLARPAAQGVLVWPLTAADRAVFAYAADPARVALAVPTGYARIRANASFAVLAGPCGHQ